MSFSLFYPCFPTQYMLVLVGGDEIVIDPTYTPVGRVFGLSLLLPGCTIYAQ